MAKIRRYKCPACAGEFDFMHHPSDEPPPRFCPICGHDSEAEDPLTLAITAPHIQKSIVKAVDATYNQMVAQADERIAAAVEATGQDAADFADMKITDLRDNLRPGDIAAPPPPKSADIVNTMIQQNNRSLVLARRAQ